MYFVLSLRSIMFNQIFTPSPIHIQHPQKTMVQKGNYTQLGPSIRGIGLYWPNHVFFCQIPGFAKTSFCKHNANFFRLNHPIAGAIESMKNGGFFNSFQFIITKTYFQNFQTSWLWLYQYENPPQASCWPMPSSWTLPHFQQKGATSNHYSLK